MAARATKSVPGTCFSQVITEAEMIVDKLVSSSSFIPDLDQESWQFLRGPRAKFVHIRLFNYLSSTSLAILSIKFKTDA